MEHWELEKELKLKHGFCSIKRLEKAPQSGADTPKGCSMRLLQRAFEGETLIFRADALGCRGAATGFGFSDGIPDTPGGFGYFLSYGRGEGFPPGERVKCSPELSERMMLAQPQGVMRGYEAIRVKPYAPEDGADVVTALVTMDQLAALIHLFGYRSDAYDNVIAPMVSGCASVFRIPFGEADSGRGRAVVGNIDVFSRPHFPAETAFFSVPGRHFSQMLADAGESMLVSPVWKGVQKRL